MIKQITREEILARQQAQETIIFVEVLPAQYYEKEHLPGAINIDADRIDTLASTVLPDKTATIITYCANHQCNNSTVAAHNLTRLGYQNVFKYTGGKQDWMAAGLPVERSNTVS